MVLYVLSLLTLAEVMRETDLGVLHKWYTDDADMQGPARRNAKLLHDLMEKVPYNG